MSRPRDLSEKRLDLVTRLGWKYRDEHVGWISPVGQPGFVAPPDPWENEAAWRAIFEELDDEVRLDVMRQLAEDLGVPEDGMSCQKWRTCEVFLTATKYEKAEAMLTHFRFVNFDQSSHES